MGVKVTYWALIGADKCADNSLNEPQGSRGFSAQQLNGLGSWVFYFVHVSFILDSRHSI